MCDDMWSVALIYLSAYTSLLIKVSLPGYSNSSRYEMLLSRTSTLSLRGPCGTTVSLLKAGLRHYLPDYFMTAL